MDPYTVLGLDPGANATQLEAAYTRRRRLHDPAEQTTAAERAAAERYHAELDAAYATLLQKGARPSLRSTPDPAVPHERAPSASPTPRRPVSGSVTTREDWIRVTVALVACYTLVQLPLRVGLGFVGALAGWFGALAVVVLTWRHLRRARR